jgi:tetratricopeptide (TPR) repeat protein
VYDIKTIQIDSGLSDYYFSYDKLRVQEDANMLKGGIAYADYVTTVSDTYAEEIKTEFYGEGLNGLLWARRDSLCGIVNGIDYNEYNPETDQRIPVRYNPITFRKENVEDELEIISKAVSSKQVQKAGDKLDEILKFLTERNELIPITLIKKYFTLKGESFFDNSLAALVNHIKSKEHYPEVYKLIGDIYKLEGEYTFAEEYYSKALNYSSVFDIPNDKYEVLYLLAEISEINQDFERMEIRLLNILVDDPFYKNKNLTTSMYNTLKSPKKDSFEKFFKLYTASNYFSLKAYYKLSDYYYNTNQIEKAINFASLSVITSVQKINEIIKKRNINFEYKNIESLLYQIQYYEDIIQWGNDNNVWASFNLLARLSTKVNNLTFSTKLLKVLAQYSPEEYWRKEAVLQLSLLEKE